MSRVAQEDLSPARKTIRNIFETLIVFNRVIGLQVIDERAGKVQLGFSMRDDLVGHHLYGRLHGGVISTVLDACAGFAVMSGIVERFPDESEEMVLGRYADVGTIDLRVDFLRPGVGTRFTASAELTRLGKRIASVQMRLENEAGVLIATGSSAYIVSR